MITKQKGSKEPRAYSLCLNTFSGRNPPAWWSGGTPRQSRRSLQFNSVVWCLVVWGPGGFGIQSGYLLYVLLIFIHFNKRIPTESKPLGPKPPINHQLINVLQNGCRRKCLLVKNRVDETSAVITVDGSFWLI